MKNDDHALEALGGNSSALRHQMTGVRGGSAKEKLALYNADMREMFHEVARVLKPGAKAAFVIGDATVDRTEYTTTQDMAGWAVAAGLIRSLINTTLPSSATFAPMPGASSREKAAT